MNDDIKFNWLLLKSEIKICVLIILILLPAIILQLGLCCSTIYCVIFTSFIVIAAIFDIKYFLLFNRITYTMILLGIIYKQEAALIWGGSFAIIMFFIRCIKPEGMGLGDIKYSGAIGCWLADERIFLAMAIAFSSALIYACYLIIRSRSFKFDLLIPLGPFLSLAGFFSYLWGG